MALGRAAITLFEVLGFCLAFASLGNLLLRYLRFEFESDAEHFLSAVAVGLVTTEVLLFMVQLTQRIRLGCWLISGLLCVLLLRNWSRVWEKARGALREMAPQSRSSRFLLILIAIVASVEFLSALAPLTGSDALQYHFTIQKQILEYGFHPIFSNSHSFACGQHHLLILLGLGLGSEKLSLGFIFLGGVLTAASLACLASRWASPVIVTGFALIFLLSPLAFWQLTSSGSPDIYMAFLASTAVIVLVQEKGGASWRQALLVGLLAGGVAGAKYTGCFLAAALALAAVIELRSVVSASFLLAGSLASGIWPYLRNLAWTGNPIFPFLAARLSPGLVTSAALANMYTDTGTATRHSLIQVLPFVFFAGVRPSGAGLWEFYGPTVLVLAPLTILAIKNERRWRVLILVWLASSLGISSTSGLARFLLPVYPIALACSAAGFEQTSHKGWKIVRGIAGSLLVFALLAGAVGLVLYCKPALRVAVGLEDEEKYLKERAPDYQIAQTINALLGRQES